MKKIDWAIVLGMLTATSLLADTATFRNGVDGYMGTDDTTIDEGYSNRNAGGHANIIVGDKVAFGHYRKGLLRFDLTCLTDSLGVGEAIQINSASLWIRVTTVDVGADTTGGTQDIHLYAVSAANANWIEGDLAYAVASNGEATWAKKYAATTNWAGTVGLGTAGTDYNATEAGSFLIDMPKGGADQYLTSALTASIAQGWIDDASSNGGLLMDMELLDKGHVAIYSSESGTTAAPELTIDYTVGKKVSSSMVVLSISD